MSNTLEVKVKNIDLVLETTEYSTVKIQDNCTVAGLLGGAGVGWADLSKYYHFSGFLSFNLQFVPFVMSKNRILYNVPFEKVKVVDFLETHQISSQEIVIYTGYPWAGGPGIVDLETMWTTLEGVLVVVGVLCSISGITIKDTFKYLKSTFKKRKRSPQVCFDIIYSRTIWNHHELASLLHIEPERTKNFLRVLGYEYDQRKKAYIAGKQVSEIKEKLKDVKGLSHDT